MASPIEDIKSAEATTALAKIDAEIAALIKQRAAVVDPIVHERKRRLVERIKDVLKTKHGPLYVGKVLAAWAQELVQLIKEQGYECEIIEDDLQMRIAIA
jgi:chorismate mutase